MSGGEAVDPPQQPDPELPTPAGEDLAEGILESIDLDSFNALFGDIDFTDSDRIRQRIAEDLPASLADDEKYVTAVRNNDQTNAKVAMQDSLDRMMLAYIADETQLYKLYSDNPGFRSQLANWLFQKTYDQIKRRAA